MQNVFQNKIGKEVNKYQANVVNQFEIHEKHIVDVNAQISKKTEQENSINMLSKKPGSCTKQVKGNQDYSNKDVGNQKAFGAYIKNLKNTFNQWDSDSEKEQVKRVLLFSWFNFGFISQV